MAGGSVILIHVLLWLLLIVLAAVSILVFAAAAEFKRRPLADDAEEAFASVKGRLGFGSSKADINMFEVEVAKTMGCGFLWP